MSLAPFIYALGWSLLHSLWQGALLCGVAYILLSLFYLSAKDKVNLLFTLLFLLLIAFMGTFLSYWPQEGHAKVADEILLDTSFTQQTSKVNQIPFLLEHYFPHLVVAYLVGFLFQLVALIGGYVRIQQLKQSPKELVPVIWQRSFNRLSRAMRIRRTVGFFLSAKVHIPTVIGYFKPIILFPIAVVSALDSKQVEAILIHELTHINRRDYALNLMKCIIEAFLFFNPFVWVLGRMITKEREHACDDAVLNLTGDTLTYARALLALESMRSGNMPALALGAFGKREYLFERIKRMTIMKTETLNIRHKLAAMIFISVGLIGLAWINPSTDPASKPLSAVKPPKAKVEIPTPPVAPTPSIEKAIVVPPQPPKAIQVPDTPKVERDTTGGDVTFKAIDESLENFFSSKEWKDYQQELQYNSKKIQEEAEKIRDQFNTPEWNSYQEELARQHEFFNSQAWKEELKELGEQAKQMGLQAIRHDSAYFKSGAWKEKEKAIVQKSENLALLAKQFEARVNSPEMKQKREEFRKNAELFKEHAASFRKQIESPEFKARQKEMQERVKELAKKYTNFDTMPKTEEQERQ